MIHLAAALFFTVALLGAAVAIHMTARAYWPQILAALRGELGREVRRPARPAQAYAARRHAAF